MNKQSKSFLNRIIFSVFGLLIIAFVVYHTFNSVFDPYITEEAVETTVNKSITADCYVVRKESVINSDYKGFKVNSVSNGNRIAKDATAVNFYTSESDVSKANEINEVESFIEQITEINRQNAIYSGDLDTISEQIKSNLYSFLSQVNSENFAYASDYAKKLKYYLAQSQLATGREDNYDKVIKQYTTELKELKADFKPNVKSVKSDYSGYFVNVVDGYENSVDYDKIDELTVQDFNKIKSSEVSKKSVGKVITENEWYIVTTLDTTDIKTVSKGDRLKVHTSLSSANELSTTVVAVNKDSETGKSVLILSCMKMNEELSQIRHKDMQIVLNSYTGLRVNSKSVRIKDGEKGVYIKLGATLRFIKTDIIYNSSDYVIVNSQNLDNQLKIYDDVVVKGKGLDG